MDGNSGRSNNQGELVAGAQRFTVPIEDSG